MRFPSRETVEGVRKQYPAGTRVRLVRMDDPQAPPIGTHGTVNGVDDTGSLLMSWDNGSGLNVVYGEDAVKILDPVKVICYGKEEEWEERSEAIAFYRKAEKSCDPDSSERLRYLTIWEALVAGEKVARDE